MQALWYQVRIIVSENLELRDNCQKEGHTRQSQSISLREQGCQLVVGQLNQAKYVLKQLQVCVAHSDIMEKRQSNMIDKGGEYRKKILDKKPKNLLSRIIRKSSQLEHPVSVPGWGLLDSPGKISNFKTISGVRPSSKFLTGEITKPAGDNMKILQG